MSAQIDWKGQYDFFYRTIKNTIENFERKRFVDPQDHGTSYCIGYLKSVLAAMVKPENKPMNKQIILRSVDGLESKPFVIYCDLVEWKTRYVSLRETAYYVRNDPSRNYSVPTTRERVYKFHGKTRDNIEIFEEVI